jgi:hypothetical protein
MNTYNGNVEKLTYCKPSIVKIKLDNEISLALESALPPGDPGTVAKSPDYFNNDPFGNNIG